MREKGKRDFRGEVRIDMSDRHQVEFWMKRWGVSRDQLVAAHRRSGHLVKDIATDLGKKR